jgi:hypothetical protein
MRRILLAPALLLAAGFAHQLAQAAQTDTVRRVSVSVLQSGKEIAGVMLPAGARGNVAFKADRVQNEDANTVHATGHVQFTLTLPQVGPITFHGDELVLRVEELDAGKASAIRDLEAMGATDQEVRGKHAGSMTKEDWARQTVLDQANLERLASIVERYGWPGLHFAGAVGSQNAFMVVQHAELPHQQKYLPLLREAAARKEALPSEVAMLEDRVRVRSGQPQLYGSQFKPFPDGAQAKDATLELYPIEDEAHVEERRRAVGLMPLPDYVKLMRATYGIK